MTVPVRLGASTFDFEPLRQEQTRVSKSLLKPTARDQADPSQAFMVSDIASATEVANTYSTYIKMYYTKEGDVPTYRLYMKDNLNVEHELASTTAGTTLTININETTTRSIECAYTIDAATGKICKTGNTTPVGYVKFEAESGLSVASINSRLSDINQALEGLGKVMSAVIGTLDNAVNLIR